MIIDVTYGANAQLATYGGRNGPSWSYSVVPGSSVVVSTSYDNRMGLYIGIRMCFLLSLLWRIT